MGQGEDRRLETRAEIVNIAFKLTITGKALEERTMIRVNTRICSVAAGPRLANRLPKPRHRVAGSLAWLAFVVVFVGVSASISANPIYVDDDAPAGGDGTSWATAFTYLQDALAVAVPGDEIRVAGGTYRPDRDEAGNVTPGDRTATFRLKNGVALMGGYAGLGAPDPDQRDFVTYETILSGDLSGDDASVACTQDSPDCDGLPGELCVDGFCIISNNNDENSFHIVTGSSTDATAVIDGFTVAAGNADETSPNDVGGGVYIDAGDPFLNNCIVTGNYARFGGGMLNQQSAATVFNCSFIGNAAVSAGGMYNLSSSTTVTHCIFDANAAVGFAGGMSNQYSLSTVSDCIFSRNVAGTPGGGMANTFNSNPTVTRCLFESNVAISGGGMYNSDSNPIVLDCSFRDNSGLAHSGGMLNAGSSPTVSNCRFDRNTAPYGGGMHNWHLSNPSLFNSTFSANRATLHGGAIYNDEDSSPFAYNCTFSANAANGFGGGIYNSGTGSNSPTLANSVLWANVADADGDAGGPFMGETAQIHTESGMPTVDYSIVQGGWSGAGGVGVSNANPLFVDAEGPDGVPGTEDDDLRLMPGSPAIDAGDNGAVPPGITIDLDGNLRFVDDPATSDTGAGLAPIVDMGAFELQVDCNANGVADATDIESGTSLDCNANGVPDECEPDCNTNGVPDACDIADGTSEDCDFSGNGIPDECEPDCDSNGRADSCDIALGFGRDCNDNNVLDTCDIADGASEDCTSDGIPDECDPDCNSNGVPDSCDIDAGTSLDCTCNRVPDECEPDCNSNGVADSCDIDDGVSEDCASDGIPDECEADCNNNGVADSCDLASGAALDCNGNDVPDFCDLATGASFDCNGNGVPDSCEPDCNRNSVADSCDIADGTSQDCNSDGRPDECDCDCNENGVPDGCDIEAGTSEDCNSNGTPDECATERDCNENGVPDACDLEAGTSQDCNANGTPDECPTEPDCNSNGVPDNCEVLPFLTVYVDDDAGGGGDGLSWTTAMNDLQDALAMGACAAEIRVAQGTYTPGTERTDMFQLTSGAGLFGGYAGPGMPDPDARDVGLYETILSGDLNGDDIPFSLADFVACLKLRDVPLTPECEGFDFDGDSDVDFEDFEPVVVGSDYNLDDNSFHVVSGSLVDVTAVLDGFVVAGGNAFDTSGDAFLGAGMLNLDGSPTVTACVFRNNFALYGGGMANFAAGGFGPVIGSVCGAFTAAAGERKASADSFPLEEGMFWNGAVGAHATAGLGGSEFPFESSPIVTGCTFEGNFGGFGGGMLTAFGSPRVSQCTFRQNFALAGGGIVNAVGTAVVEGSFFTDNTGIIGGAMYNGIFGQGPTTPTPAPNLAGTVSGSLSRVAAFLSKVPERPSITRFPTVASGQIAGQEPFLGTSPRVSSCVFARNYAIFLPGFGGLQGLGGAVVNALGGSVGPSIGGSPGLEFVDDPIFSRCLFDQNIADGVGGGGMASFGFGGPAGRSSLTLEDCVFSRNAASGTVDFLGPALGGVGGGLFLLFGESFTANACVFTGNSAGLGGGVASLGSMHLAVNDSVFSGNTAAAGGGLLSADIEAAVNNCTFSGNTVTGHQALPLTGGAIGALGVGAFVGMPACSSPVPTELTVSNCVLWGDSPDEISGDDSGGHTTVVRFSDVAGGVPSGVIDGGGNIDADPMFVDTDLRLGPGSPCIDAGNNSVVTIPTDLDGNMRIVDDPDSPDCPQAPGTCGTPPIVDMGAYEFGSAPCGLADLNCDGDVDLRDFGKLQGCFGVADPLGCNPIATPDLNGSGQADLDDYVLFVANLTGPS